MITQELEQILFRELGYYTEQPGFQVGDEIEWRYGRPIDKNITAVMLLQNEPVAYFSRFTEVDVHRIQALHKKVWSQSKSPLLFVTLPHEIRIYNGYEPTPIDANDIDSKHGLLLQQLQNLSDQLTAQQEIKQKLTQDNHYERVFLESGTFWETSDAQKIKISNRADQLLIQRMKEMRRLLVKDGKLTNSIAYTLLGRSLFIRYLEDRGFLTEEMIGEMTEARASNYPDALNDRETAYLLYESLSHRFNGDLFPVEPDEEMVGEQHLRILQRFLNREDLITGQLSLWRFRFDYIPVELISHIYDIFLDEQRSSGAYYTPPWLADFILEETMGQETIRPDMKVLDPACGSGIFLVGSYRRLVNKWEQIYGSPSTEDLTRILRNNLFGVDLKDEAVRIAAFSLYLEMLNHVTSEQVQDPLFRFPSLYKKNLLPVDFFSEDVDQKFADCKFDRIVGNMPWGKGSLTNLGKQWLKQKEYIVGDKQAAPAFMLRLPKFCQDDGEIALLSPSKSTLHVTNTTHKKFRDQFLSTFNIRAIVNFSALRHELFGGAKRPTIAAFYSPGIPNLNTALIYAIPKPSLASQYLKAVILDTTEIKSLNRRELTAFPELWKIALWGTPRDAALIERLKRFPTLENQLKQLGWSKPRRGFEIGESEDEIRQSKRVFIPEFLRQLPFLPTQKFEPYSVDTSTLTPVTTEKVYLTGSKEQFYAPLVLIHRGRCKALYSETDVSYLDSISGFNGKPGQENLLKWLVCVVNSSLTRYYQFLTSTRWAIERDSPLHNEYLDMPFFIPGEDDPDFQQILIYFDEIIQKKKPGKSKEEYESLINSLVFKLYDIHAVEQQLVQDTLDYGIKFFEWAKRKKRKLKESPPVKPPTISMLQSYAEIFSRSVTSILKTKQQTLNATVYQNGAPLTVVTFDLVDLDKQQPVHVVTNPDVMRDKLRKLDRLLLDQQTPSMYIRRHVRIYAGQQVSLVRPSERRFWTQSQARVDADAFIAELFS